MLMHGENSSLQDNSAQQRTDPILPGTGISPTASQTAVPSHQCCKYLAKTCQGCQHALSLPAKAAAKTAATHLPTSHTARSGYLPATQHVQAVTHHGHDGYGAWLWGGPP